MPWSYPQTYNIIAYRSHALERYYECQQHGNACVIVYLINYKSKEYGKTANSYVYTLN